jgi:hypothetical protein
MGIPLEEYAKAFEIITMHALPMITVAASETMLRRDMTIFLPVEAPAARSLRHRFRRKCSFRKERIADFKLDNSGRRPNIFAPLQENSRTMRLIRLLIALARIRLGRWLIQSGAILIETGTWLIKL